jgi:hypothetical protein
MVGKPSAKKDKLLISTCSVDAQGNIKVDNRKSFQFMLNPSAYDHSFEIGYNKKEAIGQSGSDVKFSGVKPEKLKFNTMLDGTGAVSKADASPDEVKVQIKNLMDVVYKYDGDKHEPSHVRVLWGSQIFFGRLENIAIENTLFKPSGEPVRAKVELEFTGFMSKEEEGLRANRSSPDMSHLIEVKAGDTLPLLCYQVYRDSSYYLDIARVNNITDFRDIKPGSKLHFPPLR